MMLLLLPLLGIVMLCVIAPIEPYDYRVQHKKADKRTENFQVINIDPLNVVPNPDGWSS